MFEPKKFLRKPLTVEAVRVDEGNINQVADWCGGTVVEQDGKTIVKLKVIMPAPQHRRVARIGDWILKSRRGFKVWTDVAFQASFEPAVEDLTLFKPLSDIVVEDPQISITDSAVAVPRFL